MASNASGCRRCGKVLDAEAMSGLCSPCVIRAYLADGDDALLPDFIGLGIPPVAQWFLANPDEAFSQLHDEGRMKRLKAAGLSNHHFAEQLTAAIDATVSRLGGTLDPSERAAARLLAASAGKLTAVHGQWMLMPDLPADQRRVAVAALADGRFDAVRGIDPAQLVCLAAQPWCSQLRGARQWFAGATAEAVRRGLDRIAGGGSSAITRLNVCLVHAASCIGDEDDFELRELAEAAGLTDAELHAMRAEVSGRATPAHVLRPGTGTRDAAALAQHAAFRRAREWLGFDLDLNALDEIDRLCAELPAVTDQWVRWAFSSAMVGPAWERMLGLLVGLGDGRKSREAVLAAARRSGLLAGKAAEEAFRAETAAVAGGGYELRVFSQLFEQELKGRQAPGNVAAIISWYERARADYFADASALGRLPTVGGVLRELRGHEDLPYWLGDLVAGLADFEWKEMLAEAERGGHGWIVRLVEQVIPQREDPRLSERVRALLPADDLGLLRELARRAAPGSSPPWYALRLDAGADFRMREAAFACGFLGEPEFKAAIAAHAKPIWDNQEASPDEAKTLKALCTRCGRSMLGRLRDAEPRLRTLESFRRSDWRGMLEAERVEASGLPLRSVPTAILSPVAAISFAAAAVLSCVLIGILLLGGSADRPQVIVRAAAKSPPWTSPQMDLRDGWVLVAGSKVRWARRIPADEIARLVPSSVRGAGDRVGKGVALEFADRYRAALNGPGGRVKVSAGTRPIDAGKVTVSLPATQSEATACPGIREDEAWILGDADAPATRRWIVIILEVPPGASDA